MSLSQDQAPIMAAMAKFIGADFWRLHMPGHKGGQGWRGKPEDFLGRRALQADLTEVPGLDDLHQPLGPIKEAQALAAAAFGAAHTFFLVNGASAGIQAAFLALLQPGDKVLLPRHAHKAVFNALVLSGARPVFVAPRNHAPLALPLGVSGASWRQAWTAHPDAKAIFLINPSYEGVVAIDGGLVEAARAQGLFVIVDEAHGGHLAFHPALPPSALSLGADVVVHGSHKTVGSLTQSGMLHLGPRMEPELFQTALGLLQSTSPSYLLLASLDGARHDLVARGRARLSEIMDVARGIRNQIKSIKGIRSCDEELYTYREVKGHDPTKIVIDGLALGLTGYDLANTLREKYRIQLEMATAGYGLALLSLGDDQAAGRTLAAALTKIAGAAPLWEKQGVLPFIPDLPAVPEVMVSPREAYFRKKRTLFLQEAGGAVCGEMIIPYPPGIPLLGPGELISASMVDRLLQLREQPLQWQGWHDAALQKIRVLAD